MAQTSAEVCTLLFSSLVIPADSAYTLAAISFTFGFYALLFSLAIYFLLKRPVVVNRQLYLFWLISLFVLSSTSAALRTAQVISRSRATRLKLSLCIDIASDNEFRDVGLGVAYHTIFILVNCLSDSIIIYRLFVIWRRRITIIPIITSILVLLLGLGATIMTGVGQGNPHALRPVNLKLIARANTVGRIYDTINAAFNFLLTLTLAGRIWWVNHKAFAILSPAVQRKYATAVTILLESGVLYPLTLIAHVATNSYLQNHYNPYLLDIAPLAYQMAGIAPTLIILRSMLRKSLSTEPQISSTANVRGLSELEMSISETHWQQHVTNERK